MSTVNATHRKRLARALAAQQGIGYLAALDQVTKAATAGRLPSRLDDAGLAAALRILTDPNAAASQPATPRLSTHVTVQETLEALPNRKKASDPRDQQIFDLSAVYEEWTGKQGLMYISSPGGGKDKYVFGSGDAGGHVCLGREEALTHIMGLVNNAIPPSLPKPADSHNEAPVESTGAMADADRLHLEKPYLALLRKVWQGRVTVEVVHPHRGNTHTRWAIDNEKTGPNQEIQLHGLLDLGHIEVPPLMRGDEWAIARTTELGDEVLAHHGADTDKFTDGLPAKRRKGPRAFTIKRSDIARCPISSMSAEHYREDGSCRCIPDPTPSSGMAPMFTVRTKREALALERAGAWQAEAFDDDGTPIRMHVPRTLAARPKGTWRDLDPNIDRLMGGPTATKVYDNHDRRVNATCDVCDRRLVTGEPWWMVYSPGRNWENNAGVACISHRPDLLPVRVLDEEPSPEGSEGTTQEGDDAGTPVRSTASDGRELRVVADEVARAAAATVHAARPNGGGTHCAVCMQRVKRIRGGQGPAWIHTESGAVAAAGGDPQHPLNQSSHP